MNDQEITRLTNEFLDKLSLTEHERTLVLYGAVCALDNAQRSLSLLINADDTFQKCVVSALALALHITYHLEQEYKQDLYAK